MNSNRKLNALTAIALTLCASLVALPVRAQTNTNTNVKPAPSPKAETGKKETAKAEKKARPLPFQGTLGKVDKVAKAITIGERTFVVSSETKIFKDSKPAQLSEGVAGEHVTGSYHKTEDGKLIANSIYFGGKTEGKAPAKTTPKAPEKHEDGKTVQ